MKKIWLSSPHMSDEGYELEYVNKAFDSNWIAPLGENVDKFENEFQNFVGSKYSLALSSGTAAIHLALKVIGVKKDDIVICQSFTFAATANPIIYEKATPVFIDSELDTWNMDPDLLEKALVKYPNVKAVIIVHLYGIPANIKRIKSICEKHKVLLIEDAAESLGTFINLKHTGTYGDIGIFSFNGNKIITTSGGGMLVTDNIDYVKKAKFLSTQARENFLHYEHKEIGYNYRLSNVLAGIGRGQLKVLERRVQKKNYIYNFYQKELQTYNELVEFMPQFPTSNNWLTCILLKTKALRDEVINKLRIHEIESRPLWKPMHMQPVYKDYYVFLSGVSENLFNRGLCLPSDTKMTKTDLGYICEIIKEVLNEYK